MYMSVHVHEFMNKHKHAQTCLYHVQTCMYRYVPVGRKMSNAAKKQSMTEGEKRHREQTTA